MKSNTDGAKRTRPINVVVCLDTSGSMNSMLKYPAKNGENDLLLTRLNLARTAIAMLYEKLQDNDVFSLVIFHTKASTIIKSTFIKNLSLENFQSMIKR
jgi:hypothetical protein